MYILRGPQGNKTEHLRVQGPVCLTRATTFLQIYSWVQQRTQGLPVRENPRSEIANASTRYCTWTGGVSSTRYQRSTSSSIARLYTTQYHAHAWTQDVVTWTQDETRQDGTGHRSIDTRARKPRQKKKNGAIKKKSEKLTEIEKKYCTQNVFL